MEALINILVRARSIHFDARNSRVDEILGVVQHDRSFFFFKRKVEIVQVANLVNLRWPTDVEHVLFIHYGVT